MTTSLRSRQRRVGLLGLACLGALSAFLSAAASNAATPKPPANDGLPRKWIGVTEFKADSDGLTPLTAHANVTFTLVKTNAQDVRRTGPVFYYYTTEKGSKLHVQHSGTSGCTYKTDVVVPLVPGQGQLSIQLTRRPGKPAKVEYWVATDGLPTYPETEVCPESGTFTANSPITWVTSGPPRRMRLTAKMLQGTYEVSGVRTDEWCLVRSRPDVLKCNLGIGPE